MPQTPTRVPVLMESAKRYFTTGQYSDMQVKDKDDKVYNVHKFVVCSQSQFFENAMKEVHFKEGHTGMVELFHDDPAAVKAMLEFLYTEEYDCPDIKVDNLADSLLFHVSVIFVAQKYTIAGGRLANSAHIQVQKVLNLEPEWAQQLVRAALPDIIQTTYENTLERETVLRPLLIEFASEKLQDLLKDKHFHDTMNVVDGFSVELAIKMRKDIDALEQKLEHHEIYQI